MNIEIQFLGKRGAVEDGEMRDWGKGTRMRREVAEERFCGEEDGCIMFGSSAVVFDAEDAGVDGFVGIICPEVAFPEEGLPPADAVVVIDSACYFSY